MASFEYGSAIKLTFDKPILTTLPVVTGSEYYEPTAEGSVIAVDSQYSASYKKENARDGSIASDWMASSVPRWFRIDFGAPKTLTRVRLCNAAYSSARTNGFNIEGSDDAVSWNLITSGNLPNSNTWTNVNFAATTYRYFRVYITSKYGTYSGLAEIEFYSTRDTYNVAGWTVSGFEPFNSPEGVLVPTTYTVRKVTKADDDYSVILWLDLHNRMLHPQGLITVNFTGALVGPGMSFVAPFTVTFTPTNIDPVFNPNDPERMQIVSASPTLNYIKVYYVYAQHDPSMDTESMTVLSAASTMVYTHVNDLPQ